MADPGAGGGGAPGGKKSPTETQIFTCLRAKAAELLELFDQLPSRSRLEGLDVLQDLVSATITKITAGKVRSVKFVPVEDKNSDQRQENGKTRTEEPAQTPSNNEPPTEVLPEEPKEEPEDSDMPDPPTLEEEELLIKKEEEDGQVTPVEESVSGIDLPDGAGEEEETDEKPPVLSSLEDEEPGDVAWSPNAPVLEPEVTVVGEVCCVVTPRSSRRAAQRANQRIHQVSVGENISLDDNLEKVERKDSDKEDDYLPELEPMTEGRQRCRYCAYTCSTTFQLDLHQQRIHSGKRLYECEFCQKTFSAVASLKRHKVTHTGNKQHQCPVCEKQFYQLSELKVHSVVHTGVRLYNCAECKKSYTNSANLRRHRRIHTGETPYACKECDAKYRDMASLKLHVLKHTGEKPYTCALCNKKFKTSSDYRRHERTHTGERKYKCTQCDSMFVQGWHLKQHMKIHTNERPWHCQQCGNRFRTKASLQYHTKSHLGIKDYTCHLCKKSFSTKRYLQNHQVIHTAARPYKCSVCPARFNQYPNMKRHERIHKDARPYKCAVCDKSFKYLNSLQYHEGIHRGVKKICEKCGLSFRSKAGFEKHRCDPLKYSDNVLKTVSKQDLVVQLEPIEIAQGSSNGDVLKTCYFPEKPKIGVKRLPKIVLRIPKKNLQGHKKNKSKKKKSASKKRNAESNFKIKPVEPYKNQVHFRTVSHTDNGKEDDGSPKVKYTKVVFKPVVRASEQTEAVEKVPRERNSSGEGPSVPVNPQPASPAIGEGTSHLGFVIKTEPEETSVKLVVNTMPCTSDGARHN